MTRPTSSWLPLLLLLVAAPARAQEAPRVLTLDEAIGLAQEGNAGLKAMRLKVQESQERSSAAFTNYLPRIQTQFNYLVNNNTQGILIPAGALGSFPGLGTFPPADTNIPQGGTDLFFTFTTLAQPVTHFFKIREGRGVARADVDAAEAELRKTEQEVSLGVLQAFAGLLLAERGIEVAQLRAEAAEERIAYQQAAVNSGSAGEVAERQARVTWLQARQTLLEKENEVDDLRYSLLDAIGLPAGSEIELQAPEMPDRELRPLDEYVDLAVRSNPELQSARALVQKAQHGVGAARAEYIPEVGILGAHIYQSSVPFFPKNTFGLGIQGKWTILDFGARGKVVRERRAQLGQAEQNVDIVEAKVRGQVEAAYRHLQRAADLVDLAHEAQALRTEGARLQTLQATTGYGVPALEREAEADRREADLDALKAELGYRIARAEMEKAVGTLTP